jgi:hypothetical protein
MAKSLLLRSEKMSIEDAKRILGEDPNDLPEIYYHPERMKFWVRNSRGEYVSYPMNHIRAHLKRLRLGAEEINEEIFRIRHECDVEAVASIAGKRKGIHESQGKRILVPKEQNRIKPTKGEWPTIDKVLSGMFGKEQKEWFLGWLKQWICAYHNFGWMPGQVLVLVGPPNAGKSLLQALLDHLFGGERGKPLEWMTGNKFNIELVGIPHLCIEDEFADSEKKVKDALRERAKAIAVNQFHRIEGKHQTAFTADPLWRLTISCNPVWESMAVIPPVDETTQNKISLLWCKRSKMPMPTKTCQEREAFMEQLKAETPALVHYLLEEHVVSEKMACPEGRFGVRGYHHPKALEAAEGASPEGQRMELIFDALARNGYTTWQGTPQQLLDLLHKVDLKYDFKTANSLGRLLTNRTKLPNKRVTPLARRTYKIEIPKDDE